MKSKCPVCIIFFSDDSGLSCQCTDPSGKLAIPGNLRVHFESECLNPGPNRAKICAHFEF